MEDISKILHCVGHMVDTRTRCAAYRHLSIMHADYVTSILLNCTVELVSSDSEIKLCLAYRALNPTGDAK